MTLQLKNVLTIILSAVVGLLSAWLGRAIAKQADLLVPMGSLVLGVLAQVSLVILVHSKEEEELDLAREMRLAKNRQKLAEAEQASIRILAELKEGKKETVEEVMNIRDRIL
jgi:hypothetical protein